MSQHGEQESENQIAFLHCLKTQGLRNSELSMAEETSYMSCQLVSVPLLFHTSEPVFGTQESGYIILFLNLDLWSRKAIFSLFFFFAMIHLKNMFPPAICSHKLINIRSKAILYHRFVYMQVTLFSTHESTSEHKGVKFMLV